MERQYNTIQDKTRQYKTRQDKTRQVSIKLLTCLSINKARKVEV